MFDDEILRELLSEDNTSTEDDSNSEEYHVRERISRKERQRRLTIAKGKRYSARQHKKQWGNGKSEPLEGTEDNTEDDSNNGTLSYKWIVYPVIVGIGLLGLWVFIRNTNIYE